MLHFELNEFDSPDEQGSGKYMDEGFLSMLDDARGIAGIPFIINSGFRSKSHNAYVGGKEQSSHLFGYAVDLHCTGSRERSIIISSLQKAGFNRFGIGNTFIHCDSDPDKISNVIWTY